jgi:ribokinase
MSRMPRLFVVGSFVVGITVRVPRKPVVGESLIGDLFDMGPGGKGTNQAIGASRLGGHVDLLACVGDDAFAELAMEVLGREGLRLDHVHRMTGTNTGVGLVTLLPKGENWIVGHLGANLLMRPEHVELAEERIRGADVVMTQFEVPLETVDRAMDLGRKHGALTLLNPAPAKTVDRGLLRNVDVLTPNESETRILLGLAPDDPAPTSELARRLLGFGVKRIVVTRGRRGALIVTPEGSDEVPAVAVEAVDTTGAGDAFNAALAVALGAGASLQNAVVRATRAGAYATTRIGVIDGLPTRGELDEFVHSRGLSTL